ncbi:MAG TPA: hypothetical protein DDX04_16330 [Massilia sp.]|nr:hypothetical protein [Massilia sp.]
MALALAAPSMAVAAVNLDKGLTCEMSATAFFSPIVQRRLIDIEPYAVEDSISQFRPRAQIGKNALYAFGMKVETVFGYARDQIMFLRGPGTEPENTYGVVVKEGIANVQAQLNSMGVHRAQTRRISSSRTAITCEGV